MLRAKFQDHRTSGSGEEDFLRFLVLFTIYGHGGHLGHVTWTIYDDDDCFKVTRHRGIVATAKVGPFI